MSVYIKGMEMPTSCAFCRFCEGLADTLIGTCAFCMVDGKYRDAQTNDGCPLVPVPPHGDLIDRDVLKAKQQEDADLFIDAYTLMEKSRRDEALNAVANIVNAPTIIPAYTQWPEWRTQILGHPYSVDKEET